MIRLNAYLSFRGAARQAMEYYQSVFGGKLTMTTFEQSGNAPTPEEKNNIMHAMLEGDNDIVLMASDIPSSMTFQDGTNIRMSLSGNDEATLKGYWEKLSSGAVIEQPLVAAPWGDIFGMLKDKFGIEWMVNITSQTSVHKQE